ncbi:MAG: DUF4091 domain-containing protein [Clostridia bacterium]|nr:DUF4091 domain-containing protein [Clostridia bacterium]
MNIIFTAAPRTFKLCNGRTDNFKTPERPENFGTELCVTTPRNTKASFNALIGMMNEDYLLNVGDSDCFCNIEEMLKLRVEAEFPLDVKLCIVGTMVDDDYFRRGELLLEQDYTVIARKDCAQIFCEAEIPKDIAPGEYCGKVRLFSHRLFEDEVLCGELTVTIKVAQFILPDRCDSKFYLDLWQHSSIVANRCEVKIWSDEHFRVLEGIVESLAGLGQRAVTIVATEVPWYGQSCHKETAMPSSLFEYSIIKAYKEKDGTFTYDYSAMQRYIDLCAKYGIDREISIYGFINVTAPHKPCEECFDNCRIRYYDKSDNKYKFMRDIAEIDDYIASLEQYFVKTGQISKVRVAADEPGNIDAFRVAISHLKRVAPAFKYKAAVNHVEFIEEFRDDILDIAPALPNACELHDILIKMKKEMPEKRFLHYICCWPMFPNTYIRSPLCESIFLGMLTSYLDFDGLLRWAYTCWPDNPREDIRYHTSDWAAGDTCFVYPSTSGKPLLTLRYKALLWGIEMFDMFEALKEKCGRDAVEKAAEYVLLEKDCRKMFTERFSMVQADRARLMTVDYKKYEAMMEYILSELN